jgi:hypothetical protein
MKTRILISCIVIAVVLLFTSPAVAQFTNPQFGMQFGSVLSSTGGFGNSFTNSIAPRLNLGVTKDFHLEVGTIFSSTRFNGAIPFYGVQPNGNETSLFNQNSGMFSTTMYAFGVYQVNPRLSISGGTWLERTNFDMTETAMNPYPFDNNPRGMMLGLDYKVTENLRFGFEVSASSGMSPMSPGLYQHSAFPGGYNNRNPFSRYGRW